MIWLNIIIQGVLTGGLYAMFAAGLALIFGVMRLVNIAHGDLIVLAAYLALVTIDALALNPLAAIVIVAPVTGAIGYALQRGLLNRTVGDDLLPPLLVTFGLSVIIQNGLLELFTADSRRLSAGAIEVASFPLIEGISIGVLPLVQFIAAIVIIGGLGSMWGTLVGGIVLGVAQAVGAQINPGWQLLAGHLAFLAVLAVRPQGLFPKVQG